MCISGEVRHVVYYSSTAVAEARQTLEPQDVVIRRTCC